MMDCQAEGIPPPVYQWKKVKRLDSSSTTELMGIVSGPHIHVLENGSLVIINVGKQDEGDYVCEVSNNRGSTLASISRLQIHDPVHFDKNYELIKIKSGLKVDLPCEVCGDQPIDIDWYKNGEIESNFIKLPRYNIHQNVHGNCVLSKVSLISSKLNDSGEYICSASNPYGSGKKNIRLLVEAIPNSPKSLRTLEVASREITLTWDKPFDGNSQLLDYLIQYTYHNGKKKAFFYSLYTLHEFHYFSFTLFSLPTGFTIILSIFFIIFPLLSTHFFFLYFLLYNFFLIIF